MKHITIESSSTTIELLIENLLDEIRFCFAYQVSDAVISDDVSI